MTPEAQCWNYISRNEVIMFSMVKEFLFKKGGLNLVEQSAELLYNEVSKNRFKNLSFNLFKKYFEPTTKQEYTYHVSPLKTGKHWKKINLPKMGWSDGMVRLRNAK